MDGVSSGVLARWTRPCAGDVAVGRDLAALCLGRSGLDPNQLDDAAVMVSELLTNALRHGAPPVELRVWECPLRCSVVEVRDGRERMPLLPSPLTGEDVDPLAESGRGLVLITASAGGLCGAERRPGQGKSVWFALARGGSPVCARTVSAFVRTRLETQASRRQLPITARPRETP